jgi:HAD superfamily phosphatase (TIGR01668 family)
VKDMIHHVFRTTKFIPSEFHNSFFDIDFNDLYDRGFRYIITDLDNTLISYDEKHPTKAIEAKFKELKLLGFDLVLLSNNHPPRIATFVKELDVPGIANARKPLMIGMKKAMKAMPGSTKDQTIVIGDQLVTDIYGANRFGVYSILVNPLKKKTEKWYTKMNRKLEYKMIDNIKRKFPEIYQKLGLEERI